MNIYDTLPANAVLVDKQRDFYVPKRTGQRKRDYNKPENWELNIGLKYVILNKERYEEYEVREPAIIDEADMSFFPVELLMRQGEEESDVYRRMFYEKVKPFIAQKRVWIVK